jgi:methylmalonyl-CoA epimerase
MKIEKVEHIGIKVKNLEETLKFYTTVMGIKESDITISGSPDFIRMATIKTAGALIELLQINPRELLAKFGDANTDSIHHYAVSVDNILEALAAVKKAGGTLVHEKPVQLPTGRKIAFALPKNSKVLIEYLED